jgi:uncharacterized LabA/DUF88 family protein
VDCDLIMRVMDDLHADTVDAFVFMTNDMDFFPLIDRVRQQGKAVFLCGRKGDVSNRLIKAVGNDAFFDLSSQKMLESLPTVFMVDKKGITREAALQWIWLTMLHERRTGS